jgi:SAM-dependent methyltransferase
MYLSDPTAALREIAERLRPGGIVAFHENARVNVALAMDLPVLARLQDLLARTFERSGARLEIGGELYSRMLDAGLESDPKPLVEIPVFVDQGEVAYRRWALFARSMLPKIVQYGLATEEEIRDTIERQLRDELLPGRGFIPLSWIMIAQWARKPKSS